MVNEENSVKDPDLPWLLVMGKQDNAESERIEVGWAKYCSVFPSYYRMVVTVYDDLMPKYTHKGIICTCCNMEVRGRRYFCRSLQELNLCEWCQLLHTDSNIVIERYPDSFFGSLLQGIVFLFSFTIIAQLMSERGRIIWYRVCCNYIVFLGMSIGYWNTSQRVDFGAEQRVEQLKQENAVLTHGNLNCPLLMAADQKSESMRMISALLSPRIVLIQMIPFLTAFSALAVNLSQSPIFVFDSKMNELLPPLLETNLSENSKELLLDVGMKPEKWNVMLMNVFLFVNRSRGIQFVINSIATVIAMIFVFSKDRTSVVYVISFSLIYYGLLAAVNAILPLLMLVNIWFPSSEGFTREESLKFSMRSSGEGRLSMEKAENGEVELGDVSTAACLDVADGYIGSNGQDHDAKRNEEVKLSERVENVENTSDAIAATANAAVA